MTAPSGLLSSPQLRLAKMLAASDAFQTLVEAEDATEALDAIHYEGLPAPADEETGEYTLAEFSAYRPCAILYGEEWAADRVAEQTCEYSGSVVMEIYQTAAASHEDLPTADAQLSFRNTVGAILAEMLALPWVEPYLAVTRLAAPAGQPFWADPDAVPYEGCWLGFHLIALCPALSTSARSITPARSPGSRSPAGR